MADRGAGDGRDQRADCSRGHAGTDLTQICEAVRWSHGRVDAVGRSRGQWQGAQFRQRVAELVLPGRAPWQVQSEEACLSGEPAGQGEETPPDGLGGQHRLSQTDARVQRARLWASTCTASQAALVGKRPEGRWLKPTLYLRSRMAFSISAWRRWSASRRRCRHLYRR